MVVVDAGAALVVTFAVVGALAVVVVVALSTLLSVDVVWLETDGLVLTGALPVAGPPTWVPT